MNSHALFLSDCAKNNIAIQYNEPLCKHCSFKTGGTAQYFFMPQNTKALQTLLQLCAFYNIPVTLLGGGSNVLAPDAHLPHAVISMLSITGIIIEDTSARIMCGETVNNVSVQLANAGKKSISFLYGMPGTIGGALWMNARCYGNEISKILLSASGYTITGEHWHYTCNEKDFSYKKSPFQNKQLVIVECEIALTKEDPASMWRQMLMQEIDRRYKGHYSAPCAGSVFKNNHAHGKPAGHILDELGFKGKTIGGAKVSERHANIIINTKKACSYDIFLLSEKMSQTAYTKLDISLEREIVLLGNSTQWNSTKK